MKAEVHAYTLAQQQSMLQVARSGIEARLTGKDDSIDPAFYAPELRLNKASFVTLNMGETLRGCIGSLVPRRPLILDIYHNAQAAAFQDPRFSPLNLSEYQQVNIHISVLTEAQPYQVTSREEAISKIQPGIDGLILRENGKSATFLPSVWKKIPDRENFISHLRAKAGLDPNAWSSNTQLFYYHSIEFS